MNRINSLLAGVLSSRWMKALAVVGMAGVAEAQGGNRWAPFPPASDFGHRFSELFWLITILCSISMVIVVLLLLIPLLRDRARPGHKANYDHGSSLHDKRLTAVISLATFIVLDAWVLAIAMKDLREAYWNMPEVDQAETYPIEVLGQQWAWHFRGPGLDGEFGTPDDILEMNQLTIPKGRPVSFQMTSKDVIHSLFLPEMRTKKDVNPGSINKTWFKPIEAGEFTILCAELCGYAHYQMFGNLTVMEQEDFDEWEESASLLGIAAYDPEDEEAQWAWEWEE